MHWARRVAGYTVHLLILLVADATVLYCAAQLLVIVHGSVPPPVLQVSIPAAVAANLAVLAVWPSGGYAAAAARRRERRRRKQMQDFMAREALLDPDLIQLPQDPGGPDERF
jgi:hypothetical protein